MTRTSCRRVWQVEAVRDGRLSGSDLSNALRHRGECAECERAARALDELGRQLKALPTQPIDPLVHKRTRQALLGAWNEQLLAEPRPKARTRTALVVGFSLLGGVALAFGYPLMIRHTHDPEPSRVQQHVPPSAETAARTAPAPPITEIATSAQRSAALPSPPSSVRSPRNHGAQPKQEPAKDQLSIDTAEDDAYLEILGLLRHGHEGEARAKASQYLVRFPAGFRRPEVEKIAHRVP